MAKTKPGKPTRTRAVAKGRGVRRDAGRPRGAPVLEAVLARTLEELATHGLAQLSVERIAKAAELNKTSVYRRWPTREALVAAALERVADELALGVPDTGRLRDDLLALVRSVTTFVEKPVGRALAQAAISGQAAPEIASLARRQIERGAAGAMGGMLQRAIARGEWRSDVVPEAALTMLVGGVVHRVLVERQPATDAWIAGMVDVFCLGVTPRTRPTPARRAD